jgi:DNA-binding MarR family transcriptional regulator
MASAPQTQIAPKALDVWYSLLRAHAGTIRQLDTELRAETGLTINDYDVLVHLKDAQEGSMRMGCLAERVVLSRSGMTRLIDGLVKDGLVERKACSQDARGSWAVITPAGDERLREARQIHLAGVARLFTDHVSEDELAVLGAVFDRVITAGRPAVEEAIAAECQAAQAESAS